MEMDDMRMINTVSYSYFLYSVDIIIIQIIKYLVYGDDVISGSIISYPIKNTILLRDLDN